MKPRKICFFTGTRADFGLLKPLIKGFQTEPQFQIQVMASGTHYSSWHGQTHQEILADKISIDWGKANFASLKDLDHPEILIGKSIQLFSEGLQELNPDFVFVLGDRYEALAMAIATIHSDAILCHLHGGEITGGARDEYYRHAITKLSHLHFVATEKAKSRVLRMGENPHHVHCVGALGVENALNELLLSRDEIAGKLKIKSLSPYILVSFHPHLDTKASCDELSGILSSLLPSQWDIIITGPNSDKGSNELRQIIQTRIKDQSHVHYVESAGSKLFLSLLKESEFVMGNSSSFLLEAPALRKMSINVGPRQLGRECAASVIHSGGKLSDLQNAIQQVLHLDRNDQLFASPYGKGETSQRIRQIMANIDIKNIQQKIFHDGPNL